MGMKLVQKGLMTNLANNAGSFAEFYFDLCSGLAIYYTTCLQSQSASTKDKTMPQQIFEGRAEKHAEKIYQKFNTEGKPVNLPKLKAEFSLLT